MVNHLAGTLVLPRGSFRINDSSDIKLLRRFSGSIRDWILDEVLAAGDTISGGDIELSPFMPYILHSELLPRAKRLVCPHVNPFLAIGGCPEVKLGYGQRGTLSLEPLIRDTYMQKDPGGVVVHACVHSMYNMALRYRDEAGRPMAQRHQDRVISYPRDVHGRHLYTYMFVSSVGGWLKVLERKFAAALAMYIACFEGQPIAEMFTEGHWQTVHHDIEPIDEDIEPWRTLLAAAHTQEQVDFSSYTG